MLQHIKTEKRDYWRKMPTYNRRQRQQFRIQMAEERVFNAKLAEMRQQVPRNLYAEAKIFGEFQAKRELKSLGVQYWTAWYAARQAAGALLTEAEAMGLTAEQIERLRAKAADVAYD